MQFNDMMDRNEFPFDKLFHEYDSSQMGGLSFPDFIRLNEFLGVAMVKKDLYRIFEILDKDKSGSISIDDIKNISNLTWKKTDEEKDMDSWLEDEEGLKGNDIMIK
jgi:Ca2+-binding EF-hand superfamily protein